MSHVLTLIAAPGSGQLNDALIDGVRQRLSGLAASSGAPHWLATGTAVDLPFTPSSDGVPSLADLEAHWRDLAVDAALLPTAHRRKRLLIADMDSTMIEIECIDEIADALGVKPRIAEITEQAMRGDIPFEQALRDRVSLLAGLPEARLSEIYAARMRFTPGGKALVATMKAHGAKTALVSGGFTYFTDRVREALGFDYTRANQLEIGPDGALTGRVIEPIQGQAAKRDALESLAREHGLDRAETLAVGDGANDLTMIAGAGLGVAFHAKPKVAAQADVSIRHGDLTALLYLQGYGEGEIVT